MPADPNLLMRLSPLFTLPSLPQEKALRKAARKGFSGKFGNMDPYGGSIESDFL